MTAFVLASDKADSKIALGDSVLRKRGAHVLGDDRIKKW